LLLIQGLVLGVLVGGMYALMASGLTLIFGVMRLINIAHAAVIIFASYLSWQLFVGLGVDPLLSIVILAVVFFVAGALLQKFVLSALIDKDLSLALLATLVLGGMGLSALLSARNLNGLSPMELLREE